MWKNNNFCNKIKLKITYEHTGTYWFVDGTLKVVSTLFFQLFAILGSITQ